MNELNPILVMLSIWIGASLGLAIGRQIGKHPELTLAGKILIFPGVVASKISGLAYRVLYSIMYKEVKDDE